MRNRVRVARGRTSVSGAASHSFDVTVITLRASYAKAIPVSEPRTLQYLTLEFLYAVSEADDVRPRSM